jgi:transcriptional regulator with XRE-family HTH domain
MSAIYANTSSREKISRDIADPELRHLLVEAEIRQGIPLQIRAMREDRGWTQTELAERLDTTQNTISRLESPRTSKPTITTLKRLANAFDVALFVKFAPFSEFVDAVCGMSPKSVAVPSYDAEIPEDGIERLPTEEKTETAAATVRQYVISPDWRTPLAAASTKPITGCLADLGRAHAPIGAGLGIGLEATTDRQPYKMLAQPIPNRDKRKKPRSKFHRSASRQVATIAG